MSLSKCECSSFLTSLYEDDDFNDLILLCRDGKALKAHRLVVGKRSSIFRQMLLGSFVEAKEQCIEVKYDSEAVKFCLKYCYTGVLDSFPADKTLVIQIAEFGDYYDIEKLKDSAEKHLQECIKHFPTAIAVYPHLETPWLFDLAQKVVLSNFLFLCLMATTRKQVLNLRFERLLPLIQSSNLASNELLILQFVDMWVNINAGGEGGEEREMRERLYAGLRLGNMSQRELVQYVKSHQYIPQSEYYQALEFHAAKDLSTLSNTLHTTNRMASGVPCVRDLGGSRVLVVCRMGEKAYTQGETVVQFESAGVKYTMLAASANGATLTIQIDYPPTHTCATCTQGEFSFEENLDGASELSVSYSPPGRGSLGGEAGGVADKVLKATVNNLTTTVTSTSPTHMYQTQGGYLQQAQTQPQTQTVVVGRRFSVKDVCRESVCGMGGYMSFYFKPGN
eukprot:GDKI01033185.1.p1 GENE.GDKI01033185.1~~GDKI01033185.1.p1  ORF type:complete len:450 (+),score=113.43 GDKI01033185.1:99-1448(+)